MALVPNRVFRSSIVDAPVNKVWKKIRSFHDMHHWHPGAKDTLSPNGDSGDRVGGLRDIVLAANDTIIRERLIALDDRTNSFSYEFVYGTSGQPFEDTLNPFELPGRMEGYNATVTLMTVTDGDRTFISWEGRWLGEDETQDACQQFISSIFEGGFSSLQNIPF